MNTKTIIQSYYDSFNRGDYKGMLALLSSDVLHEVNQSTPNQGLEAFEKFLKMMDHHYQESVEELVVFAEGDRAAAEFFIRGTYVRTAEGLPPAQNQKYHLRIGAFFQLQNGKIARITNYYNLQDWINQVS